MKSQSEREIVATIQAFGEDLCGDPKAIANVLDALVSALDKAPGAKREMAGPDYDSYADNEYGRLVAESEYSSNQAWRGLRDELTEIADRLCGTMEFYI
jgi:hypothetical protein